MGNATNKRRYLAKKGQRVEKKRRKEYEQTQKMLVPKCKCGGEKFYEALVVIEKKTPRVKALCVECDAFLKWRPIG